MPAYLDTEWLTAWAEAVHAAAGSLVAAAGGRRVGVIMEIIDEGVEPVRYHLQVGPDGVIAGPGPVPHPDLTFRQDRATAVRVARGELNAQAAFLSGDLRVDGDVQLLVDLRDVFTVLDEALAGVRAATRW